MVQQLFGDVEKLKSEIQRLRGLINSFTVGGQVIPRSIAGNVQLPLPIEGAILYGTSIPDWGRLPPPVTAGDDYELDFLDGDVAPSWQIKTGGGGSGDDVFTINMARAL